MTAPSTTLAAPTVDARQAHRLLGLLGMLAAPATLPFIWNQPSRTDPGDILLLLAYLAGWTCSAVAMRRLRVTGSGRGARVVFGIQILGLPLAACQQLQDLSTSRPLGDAFYMASDVAWPLSHLFMLVIFVAVWRARVWTGWRRWVPLACGLAVPATLASAVAGLPNPGLLFGLGTSGSFFALGLALLTSREREG